MDIANNAEKRMVYLVMPCYNEEEVLADSVCQLLHLLPNLPCETCILLVDDGSTDGTWPLICDLSEQNGAVSGLRLAHNVGQQTAIWAGMESCVEVADAVICIDADLQDDISVISRMMQDYLDGADVVYGVRRERASDSHVKRWTALLFYRLMASLGCDMVYNHADFRLLSRRAALALLSYPERNLFLRGIVPMLGFNTKKEYYDRQPRQAGETKYSLSKSAALAFDGITSFSVRPLHWILVAGAFFILVALGVIAWALFNRFTGRAVEGWTSLLVSLWLVAGLLLLAIGITGEYIGKIYNEVKRRPRYFVMETTDKEQKER